MGRFPSFPWENSGHSSGRDLPRNRKLMPLSHKWHNCHSLECLCRDSHRLPEQLLNWVRAWLWPEACSHILDSRQGSEWRVPLLSPPRTYHWSHSKLTRSWWSSGTRRRKNRMVKRRETWESIRLVSQPSNQLCKVHLDAKPQNFILGQTLPLISRQIICSFSKLIRLE